MIVDAKNNGFIFKSPKYDKVIIESLGKKGKGGKLQNDVTNHRTYIMSTDSFEKVKSDIIENDGDGREIEDGSLEKSPDRRAWERVSQIIFTLKSEEINDTHKKIIAGIVGTKATAKFFESLKTSIMLSAIDILTKDFELSNFVAQKSKDLNLNSQVIQTLINKV